jgi:hypothetical protein
LLLLESAEKSSPTLTDGAIYRLPSR